MEFTPIPTREQAGRGHTATSWIREQEKLAKFTKCASFPPTQTPFGLVEFGMIKNRCRMIVNKEKFADELKFDDRIELVKILKEGVEKNRNTNQTEN